MKTRNMRFRLIVAACIAVLSIGLVNALSSSQPLFSDHPFLQSLMEKLNSHQEHYKPEKVYLHFDKPQYKPGESIWLSGYIRDAQNLKASKQSDILYVELINPRGATIQDITLIAKDGQAAGDFQIPENIKGGTYKLKAYTQWQKNTNDFFEREIQIQAVVLPNLNMKLDFERDAYGPGATASAQLTLESLDKKALANHPFTYVMSLDGTETAKGEGTTDAKGIAKVSVELPKNLKTNDGLLNIMFQYKGQTESISRSVPIVLGNVDLQFFPEGGAMLANMTNGIGFKALDEFGKAADVSGEILDENGKKVADFRSYHQGMGRFEFRPQAGKSYSAKITQPLSAKGSYPLPKATENGLTLRLRGQSKEQLQIDVLSSKEEEVFVVAQAHGQMYFSQVVEAFEGVNSLSIPTSTFPVGITQITVFDSKKIARAERLAFINPHKQLNVEVQTNKEKYLPRELVKMDIKVTNEYGHPVAGQFSLAVVDDKLLTFADDKQGHILSYTLLESDLKGTIEEPNFYFDDENDPKRFKAQVDRKVALDNLLMTQGWRSFQWRKVQAEDFATMTQKGERAVIAGKVVNYQNKPVADAEVQITGMAAVNTDKDGNFVIDGFPLYQATVIQVFGDKVYPMSQVIYDYNQNLNFRVVGKRLIKGVVSNEKGKVLPKASVQVYGGSQYVTVQTNDKGEYEMEVPENSTYLYAYYGGYNQYVNLNQNKKDKIDIEINNSYAALNEIQTTSATRSSNRRGGGRKMKRSRAREDRVLAAPNAVVREMPAPPPMLMDAVVEEDFAEMAVDDVAMDMEIDEVVEKEVDLKKEEAVAEIEPAEEEIDFDMGEALFADKEMEKKPMKDMRANRVGNIRYYRARAFYAPKYEDKQQPAQRNDFRSTVYWNPAVKTDKNGSASVEFYNSDDITQFRVTVEGFGNNGQIGRSEYKYFTQLPVEILTKLPTEVLTGDKIAIPISLTNNTDATLEGKLEVKLPKHLKLVENAPTTVSLAKGEAKTVRLEAEVSFEPAEGELQISFETEGLRDQLSQIVKARPRGFPVRSLYSGDQLASRFTVNITEPIDGSLNASVRVYPSSLDQVMEGMASMLRMPGGCFEQTSSSNYPNLLALNYLRETNTSNPQLEKQARQYLDVGYGRLTGYESKGGGFDWWGRDPAHEALTAYGLMQFIDMKNVYPVDQKLIDRTTKWLMGRRDGKGSWNKNPNCLHSWATSEITDAYIVWAMTEAGLSDKVKKELDKSYQDAVKSEDPYLMGLVVNALYNAKDKRADELMRELSKTQQKDGSFMGLTASVVNSRGNSLKVETTSLAALAMMKTKGYNKQLAQAVSTLQGSKGYYGYGSTQGTVLALKAILGYTQISKRAEEDGILAVLVDGKKVIKVAYKAEQKEIEIPELTPFLAKGKHKIEVKFEQTKSPMPFEVELSYNTRMPNNSDKCNLALNTSFPKAKVNMGETVRMSTELSSTAKEDQPMAMAMIGIPAGLSVQAWQLKELKEKGVFDYYELFNGYVVLHYEYLKPGEKRTINLDLKADIPGEYEAPASCAFLYYTNEHRVWSKPERMTIN
jgi:hypothetical protein